MKESQGQILALAFKSQSFKYFKLSPLRSEAEGVHHRKVQRFGGGLVFKAHGLVYHWTLGMRVMKKKKRRGSDPRVS